MIAKKNSKNKFGPNWLFMYLKSNVGIAPIGLLETVVLCPCVAAEYVYEIFAVVIVSAALNVYTPADTAYCQTAGADGTVRYATPVVALTTPQSAIKCAELA